jgi:hypothetical protein
VRDDRALVAALTDLLARIPGRDVEDQPAPLPADEHRFRANVITDRGRREVGLLADSVQELESTLGAE